MKTTLLEHKEKLKLTVIKNSTNKVKSVKTQLLINTLYPNFTCQNATGKTISPVGHVLL